MRSAQHQLTLLACTNELIEVDTGLPTSPMKTGEPATPKVNLARERGAQQNR